LAPIPHRANFTCLQDFLDVYTTAQTALVTRQDLRDLAAAYLAQARANNITHVELFFDAQSHADRWVHALGSEECGYVNRGCY
jgi:adenosine deaminase